MASGDVLGSILNISSPGTSINRADPGVFQGSSPGFENFPVLRYDDNLDESYDLLCAMEGWDGAASLNVELVWMTENTPDGTVNWQATIRRLGPQAAGSANLNTGYDYNANAQAVTAAQAPATTALVYTVIPFDSTEVNGLQSGERFYLRVNRNDTAGAGVQTGDVSLLWPAIVIREV